MLNTIRYIFNHPFNKSRKLQALLKFFFWQIKSRVFKKTFIHKFTEKSKLYVKNGMTGATGNIYCGLHEFNDMAFLLHFLREEDLFIDVGANIGSYTVLAAKEIGAHTICIEPIPSTYKKLLANIDLNKIQSKVLPYNLGLGNEMGKLFFSNNLDTVNHVIDKNEIDSIEVEIKKLDDLLDNGNPTLIKMDVEGFEFNVLQGADTALRNENLNAIIVEINGSCRNYGVSEIDIHNKIISYGFKPFDYDPFNRQLTLLQSYNINNTIYLRDFQFAKLRIESSRKISIQNISI